MLTGRHKILGVCVAFLAMSALFFASLKKFATKHEEQTNSKDDYFKIQYTTEQQIEIEKKFAIVREQLIHANTQQKYDELLPLLCELSARNSYYLDLQAYYDDCMKLRPDLSHGPLLRILKGKDVVQISFAAILVGMQKLHDGAPLLIEWLTTKFAGEVWPDYRAGMNSVYITRGLCALASDGNTLASSFLLSHAQVESWEDISYLYPRLNHMQTVEAIWYTVVNALAYYPSSDTILALESATDFKWASNSCALIRSFMKSGDSLDQYQRELFLNDVARNKYFVSPELLAPASSSQPTKHDAVFQLSLISKSGRTNTHEQAIAERDAIYQSFHFQDWAEKTDFSYKSTVTNWTPDFTSLIATNVGFADYGKWVNGRRDSDYFVFPDNARTDMMVLRVSERESVWEAHKALMSKLYLQSLMYDFHLGDTNTIEVGDRCYLSAYTNNPFSILFVRNNVFVCLEKSSNKTNSICRDVACAVDKALIVASGIKE